MPIDINRHPCFNGKIRHQYGRIHLPVAPRCNVQCNFCNRKYDCANETRPGVTSSVLSPTEALNYLDKALAIQPNLAVVGIAGPGDPFANPVETMETLRLVRAKYPEMILCLASNGLGIGPYIDEIAELNVSHVTITISAVDPAIGAKVYAWVRDNDKKFVYRKEEGAAFILERQLDAVRRLHAHGILVKVNAILIPGVNITHIRKIAQTVSEAGADLFNVMPLIPVPDTPFGDLETPSPKTVRTARNSAAEYIELMTHCTRCRADAVGLLGEKNSEAFNKCMEAAKKINQETRPRVAVATIEGALVNLHLGEAQTLWIYEQREGEVHFVEQRKTPARGNGNARWSEMSSLLDDCRAVLVNGVGPTPREILEKSGMMVIEMEGLISDAVENVYAGREIRSPKRETRCGDACGGNGGGCG